MDSEQIWQLAYLEQKLTNESYGDYLQRTHHAVNTFKDLESLYKEDELEGQDPEYYDI